MKSKYTRSEFANILQVNKTTVSNWCGGTRTPNIDMIIRITELLDLDLYYLIGATIPSGELRPKEAELLDYFRGMNGDSKNAILRLAKIIYEQSK